MSVMGCEERLWGEVGSELVSCGDDVWWGFDASSPASPRLLHWDAVARRYQVPIV